ncbi:MAG: class I SAM-dependent methyltransferase [Rhizobiaceae bacterium]
MDDGVIKTLMLPFDAGDIETSGEDARWLFLNAAVPPVDAPFAKSQITAVQGFRPSALALYNSGWTSSPTCPQGSFDGALILLSRHRGATRSYLNQALESVKEGGMIVFAGAKNDGIATAAKEVATHFELLGNLSKHHAKVFWFSNKGKARFELAAPVLVDGRFATASGMFSSDHIDPGSAFLMEHLPKDMKGRIADFCAGWGYLSVELANHCSAVKSVALYEADYASLEAGKLNMAHNNADVTASFHWQDLISEKASGDYDTIIMNPPFHQGRAADPAIGNAIIRNAHNALHRGGKLYLVANRTLPYEQTLASSFFKSGELARNTSYKVLWAQK